MRPIFEVDVVLLVKPGLYASSSGRRVNRRIIAEYQFELAQAGNAVRPVLAN